MDNKKIDTIAIHGIAWGLTLAITDIKYGIDDKITTVFVHDKHIATNQYTSIIHSDDNGYYIKRYGAKYYLKDFIKVNYILSKGV